MKNNKIPPLETSEYSKYNHTHPEFFWFTMAGVVAIIVILFLLLYADKVDNLEINKYNIVCVEYEKQDELCNIPLFKTVEENGVYTICVEHMNYTSSNVITCEGFNTKSNSFNVKIIDCSKICKFYGLQKKDVNEDITIVVRW